MNFKIDINKISEQHQGKIKLVILLALLLPLILWVSKIFLTAGEAQLQHEKQQELQQKNANSTQKTSEAAPQTSIDDQNIQGIDVSHYQGTIDWRQISPKQIHFAIAKATGGTGFVDPQFKINWHEMRRRNIIRGAYHFFYADQSAQEQANHFLVTVGTLTAQDLPPIIDIEIQDHTQIKQLVNKVLVWLTTIEQATNRLPIIYSDSSFANQFLNDPRLAKYPLWIADYNNTLPPLPAPWQQSGWHIWQHTDQGHIQGIQGFVDRNRFNGNLKQFNAFIHKTNL